MYYVTVDKNGSQVARRIAFDDYAEAVNYLATYYKPKFGRCTLSFTTEVINGHFARSYSELADPDIVDRSDEVRYVRAVKMSNAFDYAGSFFFLIESEVGIRDADSE